MGPEAAIARVTEVRDRVRLIVGLDGLGNLAKGGRIGRVGAFLGSMLNLKVTLTVAPDGAFVPVARSRGEKAALQHTLDWVAEQMGTATSGRFAVGHALSAERAHWLKDEIAAAFRGDRDGRLRSGLGDLDPHRHRLGRGGSARRLSQKPAIRAGRSRSASRAPTSASA